MFQVAYINKTQADSLSGLMWKEDCYFFPVKIDNSTYFISKEEVEGNENNTVSWVNSLTLTDHEPI